MSDPSNARSKHARAVVTFTMFYISAILSAVLLYSSPRYWAQPYHNSALTGQQWVDELLKGHPDRIKNELGVRLHVFLFLLVELHDVTGLDHSKWVSLEEKVAIFLYMSVTGLSVVHVGERFQRSNETISIVFREVLFAISSPAFYTKYIHLPNPEEDTPEFIQKDPRFWPWFDGAIGAIDGTHIACCPSALERELSRDRKGLISQNCLAACDWDLKFIYFVSGWDGATSDSEMYMDARFRDLRLGMDKFFLADAGFGACSTLMIPFRNTRYHLVEWSRVPDRKPQTAQELYNLRHAQARNVIERIFGILKKRFTILTRPPHFSLVIQARIPPALAALHNFIVTKDPNDLDDYPPEDNEDGGAIGSLARTRVSQHEKVEADAKRHNVARAMWNSYNM